MPSLEAMHNLSRERELMAFMIANGGRFDPMAMALANSMQVCITRWTHGRLKDRVCPLLDATS